MFDYSKVDEAVRRIVEATDPRMVIVFGSVARHEAKDGSDLDLLVVLDRVENRKMMYASIARQFVGLKLPFDLFVLSYDDYSSHKDRRYSFVHEIATTGEVAYERQGSSRVQYGIFGYVPMGYRQIANCQNWKISTLRD